MRRTGIILFLASASILQLGHRSQEVLYFTDSGTVSFTSDAPLEVIKASSGELAGILNLADRSFSFSIPMKTFQGFNSALQQTHFNENYLETDRYPKSVFNGKIIEEVDFDTPGSLTVRAKGKLKIHGIEQDRTIRCGLRIGKGSLEVESDFTVPLDDHDITIPSIVQQKIADEIDVSIRFRMEEMK